MARRAIVTRPAREAAQWVDDLRARGVAAVALPLIAIAPAADAPALHRAWSRLDAYHAVMFVSRQAVDGFFAMRPLASDWRPRAWAPGPGTAAALRGAGVAPALIDEPAADAAAFDSEALWQQVAAQARPGRAVLLVRGSDAQGGAAGRDWLAARLVAAGVRVDQLAAYRRLVPGFDAAQEQLARAAAGDGSVWLFSSSQAITNLTGWLPDLRWDRAHAMASHPRIAESALRAGFGRVQASHAGLDELVASIESIE